LVLVPERV